MVTVATKERSLGGYDICDIDRDGMGDAVMRIYAGSSRVNQASVDLAAKLLVLARNLDGGFDHAIELLTAETIRQDAA